MSSEIEVPEVAAPDALTDVARGSGAAGASTSEEDSLRNDVYTAAAYGDLEKLQRLVETEGCSVSEPDGLGYYALQWVSLNNRTAAAQYILEHGGDVSASDHTGQTAPHWSAVCGHLQVAEQSDSPLWSSEQRQMVSSWRKPKFSEIKCAFSGFSNAPPTRHDGAPVAELLLKEGAWVDAADVYGYQDIILSTMTEVLPLQKQSSV